MCIHSRKVGALYQVHVMGGFDGPSFVSKDFFVGVHLVIVLEHMYSMHDCVAPTFCPLIRALYKQVVAYGQEHKRATAIMVVEKSCTLTYFQLHSGSEGRALYIHARNGDFIKAIYII